MHKGFVVLLILLCCCASPQEGILSPEDSESAHHVWAVGDSWTYLAIPPGHPTRTAGMWVYEITGMEKEDDIDLAVLEKRFEWANTTAFFITEYRDPSTLGLYRKVIFNPGYNKTEYIEEYKTPVGSIDYPLYVGKTWKDNSIYVRYKPDIPRDEYSVEGSLATVNTVTGIEDVETRVGTFTTFVIEVSDIEDGEEEFSGKIYFSPDIGKYVKLEGGRFELILGNYTIG